MQKSAKILNPEIGTAKKVENEFNDEHFEIVNILSRIYKFLKRNWWQFILFSIAAIYLLFQIIFIPISINENNIIHIKESISEIKADINKLEVISKDTPVNQANIASIKHRVEELKKLNTIGLRIYKLENKK